MKRSFALAALIGLFGAGAAVDAQAGDWLLKVGVHDVDPKSGNGHLAGGSLAADIGNNVRPTGGNRAFRAESAVLKSE